jgi:hypothetical protein
MDLGRIIVIAISVAVGLAIANHLTRKRNVKISADLEPLLRDKGPQTMPELASALGMGGFLARGKVVMALNEMIVGGKAEVIDAPPGTPQLQKVNHIRYRLKA